MDSSEYYIVKLCGAEYTIRNFFKDNIAYILSTYRIKSLEELRLKENGQEVAASNKMVLSLIKPLYNMSDNIYFNNCDSNCIGLAVKKTESLTAVLKN